MVDREGARRVGGVRRHQVVQRLRVGLDRRGQRRAAHGQHGAGDVAVGHRLQLHVQHRRRAPDDGHVADGLADVAGRAEGQLEGAGVQQLVVVAVVGVGRHALRVAGHGDRRAQRQARVRARDHAVDAVARRLDVVHQAFAVLVPERGQRACGRPLGVRDLDRGVDAAGLVVRPVLQRAQGLVPVVAVGDALGEIAVVHRQVVRRVLQAQLLQRRVVRRPRDGVVPQVVHEQRAAVVVLAQHEVVRVGVRHERQRLGRLRRVGAGRQREVAVQVDAVGVGALHQVGAVRVVAGDDGDLVVVDQIGHVLAAGHAVVRQQVVGEVQQQDHAGDLVAVHARAQPHLGFRLGAVHVVADDQAPQRSALDAGAVLEGTRARRMRRRQFVEDLADLGVRGEEGQREDGLLGQHARFVEGPRLLDSLASLALDVTQADRRPAGSRQRGRLGLGHARLDGQARALAVTVAREPDILAMEPAQRHRRQQRVQFGAVAQFDAHREVRPHGRTPLRQGAGGGQVRGGDRATVGRGVRKGDEHGQHEDDRQRRTPGKAQ